MPVAHQELELAGQYGESFIFFSMEMRRHAHSWQVRRLELEIDLAGLGWGDFEGARLSQEPDDLPFFWGQVFRCHVGPFLSAALLW